MRRPIKLYGTTWCGDCHRAKRFLQHHGIPFVEVDIDDNPEAERMVMQHNAGRRRVPTFDIDGRYYGNPPLSELGELLGVS